MKKIQTRKRFVPDGWTDDQIKLLKNTALSHDEIAQRVGRTPNAVRLKRNSLGVRAKIASQTTLIADRKELDNDYYRAEFKKLEAKYVASLKEVVVVDRIVNRIADLAPKSYNASPRIFYTKSKSPATPESAVMQFSDTHIGKRVDAGQTLGLSSYDFPTFLARLKFLENSVVSILRDHTTAPLQELVIAMLGDMLDGALLHGVEAGQSNVIFSQFFAGAHAIAQMFRNLSAHVPKIRVYTAVGNHTRMQNQHKMPSTNRFSNFDMFLYAQVQALTRDIPSIEWHLDRQPFTVFDVQGFTFHGSHGDHWKGGDKAMGIPLHAIGRQINSTTQLFHKHGRSVPNYYLCGHLHRSIQLPHGLGDVTINGGFPGLDNYALESNFNPVDPQQTFFKVHPKYGKIAEYRIHLKFAELGTPTYEIPDTFPCT